MFLDTKMNIQGDYDDYLVVEHAIIHNKKGCCATIWNSIVYMSLTIQFIHILKTKNKTR